MTHALSLGLAVATLAFGVSAARAQTTTAQDSFDDEARVTAIDLVVDPRGVTGAPPDRLEAAALTVREEGVELPVVGVAALGTGEGEEPWRLVVYFDLALSSTATVRAVSQTLAAHSATLAALGTVEVWVADPEPTPELAATREVGLIEEALSRIFVQVKGRSRLIASRAELLAARGEADEKTKAGGKVPPSLALVEQARRSIQDETLQVRRSLDGLLSWAAAQATGGPRALFWVQSGYDLDPGRFYSRRLRGASDLGEGPEPLTEATTRAAAALAGLGWVAVPTLYDSYAEAYWFQDDVYDRFRRRFQADPNEVDGALMVRVDIDKLLGRIPKEVEPPQLLDPAAPLATFEEATAGELLADAEKLPDVLRRLGERYRVTYQVSRRPDGRLRPVSVSSGRGGVRVRAPAQVRSATPEAVTEARVRRILDGETDSGELRVDARYRPAEGAGAARGALTVRVRLAEGPRTAPEPAAVPVRVTVAYADRSPGEGGGARFEHQVLADQDWLGELWSREMVIEPPAGSQWVVVVVEDLAGGQWGSWEVEVGPPPAEDADGG